MRLACFTLWAIGMLTIGAGCSRKHYRTHADQDVAEIYAEKRCEEAYTLPPLPGIDVDHRSRFFDPSPEDCPALPVPEPMLYGYALPVLVTGDPNQPSPNDIASIEPGAEMIEIDPPTPELSPPSLELPAPTMELIEPRLDSPDASSNSSAPMIDTVSLTELILDEGESSPSGRLSFSMVEDDLHLAQLIRTEGGVQRADGAAQSDAAAEGVPDGEDVASTNGLRIVPIPPEYWSRIPVSCIARMLEFESAKKEFRRSYADASPQTLTNMLSDAPRLSLPMITELTQINSRELQTRKERLYRVALALTAERYEYVLRPTRRGNSIGANYTHLRFGGITENGLRVPTRATVTKTTATAGQFLASFANDVVLTFNGSQGFVANVGSELFFDFQQTIFQRDIVFESLTRAERDVVYEARDLIRFQRSLFVDLATRYYQLLLSYRQIEISTQDYFSNLRAFLQGRAEHLKAGRIPRIQVDQFEQNALRSSSRLVRDCNSLESSLDRLKLVIGLPPEMPLNLDLTELETLTTSDELTVTRQLVIRTRRALLDASRSGLGDREAAVNGANVLVKRIVESLRVRREIEGVQVDSDAQRDTQTLGLRLGLLAARLQVVGLEFAPTRERDPDPKSQPPSPFLNTIRLIDAKLNLARCALDYQSDVDPGINAPEAVVRMSKEIDRYHRRIDDLRDRWDAANKHLQLDSLNELVNQANKLLAQTDELEMGFVGTLLPEAETELEAMIVQAVSDTVAMADRVESSSAGGLDEADVQDDQAMLLALYQRLEVMNQRGELADARRQIKLRADDLKAILDVRATQSIRTRSDVNRGFDFTFDDSETRLSLALDTPLNRRLERNAYRVSLINYNAARRALIEQEDGIKFDVREDLRQLRLRRNQYEISVASAALAYERVVSTRLQLQLAVGDVVARDFLEAQQAYTTALNSVAAEHILFILRRIGLFFDTESLLLDENGFWSAGQDESLDLPRLPDFYDVNPNPYGRLPECLHYSDEIRMNH